MNSTTDGAYLRDASRLFAGRCWVTEYPIGSRYGVAYAVYETDPAWELMSDERIVAAGTMEACEAAIRLMRVWCP